MRIDPATGQVEIAGVLYARRLQRTRAATEAIHLLMRLRVRRPRLPPVRVEVRQPQRAVAARGRAGSGFTYEGRFRNHMVTKGRNRDTDWFSVTDAEWPAVRAAHERWLDPANFDADGRQRVSLSSLTAPLVPDSHGRMAAISPPSGGIRGAARASGARFRRFAYEPSQADAGWRAGTDPTWAKPCSGAGSGVPGGRPIELVGTGVANGPAPRGHQW